MGSSYCQCNKLITDDDIHLNKNKYSAKLREIKKIQSAFRKNINKVFWKKKLYAMKLKERVKCSVQQQFFTLKYNPIWERSFHKNDVNIFSFNLNKIGRKLEQFYNTFFKDLKNIEHEKYPLRLVDEINFDTRFNEFFSNYKLLIFKALVTYFNLGKSKEFFDKCLVEGEIIENNDVPSLYSINYTKFNSLDLNIDNLTKEKMKNNKGKADIQSNADTSIDNFSKFNTHNKPIPQILIEGGTPYFCHIISYLKKEDKIFLDEREYGTLEYYYDGHFHKELHLNFGIGKMYVFESNSEICISKYYGFFQDNVYHGYGLLVTYGGSIYKGEFREGKKTGYGKEKKENYIYKGFFLDDMYNGYGEISPNLKIKECTNKKFRFKGCFKNGKRDGFGYQFDEDGSRYIGYWKEDKMNGLGLFIWKEGHRYFGVWKDDKMNGKGVYKWVNGDVFTGHYENDLKEGEGEYYFKARNSYLRGKWEQGKKEGIFSLIEGQETSKIEYRNDQIVVD